MAEEAGATHHIAILATDLAWLMGASEQAGVVVPDRMRESLSSAVEFLASPPEVAEAPPTAKKGAASS